VKVVVAILLIAAAPVCAQTQSVPMVSKDDAQRVVKIISGDQAKTQTYCDIDKLGNRSNRHTRRTTANWSMSYPTKWKHSKKPSVQFAALVDGLVRY
jgi:hypothetical protein